MAEAAAEQARKGGGRGRLLLFALVPVALLAGGGGLWASGLLSALLYGTQGGPAAAAAAGPAEPVAAPRPAPVFLDMPDIVANLNTTGRRASFVKLRSKLEIGRAEDAAVVHAAMPRLLDLFTTYLRETRPEELRGSVGTYRLREELMARANVAAAPARILDVLFLEILQQ